MNHDHDHDDALEALAPEEESALWSALVSAVRPQPLSEHRHEALLEAALLDPTAEPSDAERAAAEALRRALEQHTPNPDAELARALGTAVRGATELEAKRATQNAVARALPRPRVIAFSVAATAALSLAAAVLLWLAPPPEVERGKSAELAESRSLSPLFAHEAGAGASERLDRIVSVRSRELRDNRFSSWGVR